MASYEITDGGPLDSDNSVNGEISDPIVATSSKYNYLPWCNDINQYNVYADELGNELKVPAKIIKAVMLQESNWLQWRLFSNPKDKEDCTETDVVGQWKCLVKSFDGGIGLMQVTPSTACTKTGVVGKWSCTLGYVDESKTQGENSFTIGTKNIIVYEEELKNNPRYNIEIGVRILLNKKIDWNLQDIDASLLENWYMPLALYNGYTKYTGQLNYCAEPGSACNDPRFPDYERDISSPYMWRNFPYQELIYNHVAELDLDRYNDSLRDFFKDKIKVTLPGPKSVCDGDGKFDYVMEAFTTEFYFSTQNTSNEFCGNSSNLTCESSPGIKGKMIKTFPEVMTFNDVCVHKAIIVDQKFEPSDCGGDDGGWIQILYSQPTGHEFTPTKSPLVAVEVLLGGGNQPYKDTITLNVRESSIFGPVLASVSKEIDYSPIPYTSEMNSWEFFELPYPVEVVPSNIYVFELVATNTSLGWIWGDCYVYGYEYLSGDWIFWGSLYKNDKYFRIYVIVP